MTGNVDPTAGFAQRLERYGFTDGTVRKYRAAAAHYLRWLDGADPATQRRADVEQYLDEWHAEARPSPATVRVRVAALAKFYGYLDSLGLLVDVEGRELRNPVDRVERPRSRRRPNDWLTPEEDEAILDAPIDARERVVIALLRWTGVRIGEACALRWSDIDTARGFVHVRKSKTDSGVRDVTLLPELADELGAWQRHLEQRGLYRPDGPLLTTRNATHMKPQFAWRLVKRVAARAGVRARPAPDGSGWNTSAVTPHTFRRTLATDLLNRGARLEVVANTLGHADTRVTQLYAELLAETTRDEVLSAMRSRAS
jgi:integrase/recombinase XerD